MAMRAKRKSKAGRPPLGDAGHTRVISIKLSEIEYDAIAAAVKRAPAKTTVSGWIRDHALKPLKLAATTPKRSTKGASRA